MLMLVLSLAPAQIFADSSSQSYTVIATGIEATHIDIMSNGHCTYKVIDGYEIPRKGVIAPSGKAVVALDFGGDPIYMGVNGTTHAVGYGTTIVDLPTASHKSADGTKSWSDYPVYDIDGKETQNVTREEMAYYFANTLDDKYYKNKKSVSFSDMPENGYDEYIMKLAKADIVGGKGEGKYDPSTLVTRAEAAVFVSNILDAFQ
ncbi:MAG: S-layer homology domain-containing protein [Firmicutes bacterium]|nr:S-layer homology domain-containing protein [Bacillota bacterium]